MSQPQNTTPTTDTPTAEANGIEVTLSDGTVARWGNLTDILTDVALVRLVALLGEPDTILC